MIIHRCIYVEKNTVYETAKIMLRMTYLEETPAQDESVPVYNIKYLVK